MEIKIETYYIINEILMKYRRMKSHLINPNSKL
jgi:hypothetical protein